MTDIFREVDDDLRREKAKLFWSRYGKVIIGLIVLIVVATAGYRLFLYLQARSAAATGDRFVAAMTYVLEGNDVQAQAEFNRLIAEGSGQYPILAAMRIASGKAAAGDVTGASADLTLIADDRSAPALIRDVARLRAAMLLVDTASFADIRARLEPMAGPEQPFRYSAREMLGLSAFRAGDYAEAERYFTGIADDQNAPSSMGARAGQMLDLIVARRAAPAGA